MNKYIFGFAVLFALTGCSHYEESVSPPRNNQIVYADVFLDGRSGSANLYRRYGGSFCPPDSLENYPCRFDRNEYGNENADLFIEIEEDMQDYTNFIVERNKVLFKQQQEKIALDKQKSEWEDEYVGYQDDGIYNPKYLKDCKTWQDKYYTPIIRLSTQLDDCPTGVGCVGSPCICGFKMNKKDPWGKIREIACDYQGAPQLFIP